MSSEMCAYASKRYILDRRGGCRRDGRGREIILKTQVAKQAGMGQASIEETWRNLINNSLELTGIRWTVHGAEGVIPLRTVYINRNWKDYVENSKKVAST